MRGPRVALLCDLIESRIMLKNKRATKIRDASEFSVERLNQELRSRQASDGVYGWSLEKIYDARAAQMRGQFDLAAKLAKAMQTDDAISVAHANRLAPQSAIKVQMKPASEKARAVSIAVEADALFGQKGIALTPSTVRSVHGCLATHGVAFAFNRTQPRDDGSRLDMFPSYWPIEFVRWCSVRQGFMARIDLGQGSSGETLENGFEVPIRHGDGRWIVFSKCDFEPWINSAAILPGATIWARHAHAIRDWAKGSVAHGNAKVIGEMPAGVPLQTKEGALTAEAAAMLALLDAIALGEAPTGIRPTGSKVDFLVNSSTAWQVWDELSKNAEKAAARVYLGTDGTLGTQGGAPGVDITALFGVATTIVQGDLEAIERGFREGLIEPWCALNFGDSSLAPSRLYMLPDADEEAKREGDAKRRKAFFDDIKATRDQGFVVDQAHVEAVAKAYDIDPPRLPEATTSKAPTVVLAPTDIARVTRVNEARASAGLPPLTLASGAPDPDGQLTVSAFAAKVESAKATPGVALPPPRTPAAQAELAVDDGSPVHTVAIPISNGRDAPKGAKRFARDREVVDLRVRPLEDDDDIR